VGISVDDHEAVTVVFAEVGLKLRERCLSKAVGSIACGLEAFRVDTAMRELGWSPMLELVTVHSPSVRRGDRNAPANTLGSPCSICSRRHRLPSSTTLRAPTAGTRGEVEQCEEPSIGSATKNPRGPR